MASHGSDQQWWPTFNVTDPDSVSLADYREWYSHYSTVVGPNITDCNLDEEMNKVPFMRKAHYIEPFYSCPHLLGFITPNNRRLPQQIHI